MRRLETVRVSSDVLLVQNEASGFGHKRSINPDGRQNKYYGVPGCPCVRVDGQSVANTCLIAMDLNTFFKN
jgi:hypothetical protein